MKKWYSQQEALEVLNQIFQDNEYEQLEQQMRKLVIEKIPLPKAPYYLEIKKEEPKQQKKPKIILKKKGQVNEIETRSIIEMRREALREEIRQESLENTFASKRKVVVCSSNLETPNVVKEENQDHLPFHQDESEHLTKQKNFDNKEQPSKEEIDQSIISQFKEQYCEIKEEQDIQIDEPESLKRKERRRKSQKKRQRK